MCCSFHSWTRRLGILESANRSRANACKPLRQWPDKTRHPYMKHRRFISEGPPARVMSQTRSKMSLRWIDSPPTLLHKRWRRR